MPDLTPEQLAFLAQEIEALEHIAESLYHEIGNEATVELRLRIQEIKKKLRPEDWS